MRTQLLITEKSSLNFFTCHKCKKEKFSNSTFSTGYGVNDNGEFICYECCGIEDREKLISMLPGKVTKVGLYYTHGVNGVKSTIGNWPGSLKINVPFNKVTRHNWGLPKYHYWFTLQGSYFYGYTIGNNTQIAHVTKLKKPF